MCHSARMKGKDYSGSEQILQRQARAKRRWDLYESFWAGVLIVTVVGFALALIVALVIALVR